MSTNCNIKIARSKEWLAAQQLERGENLCEQITVGVAVADLTTDARKILLVAGGNSYPRIFDGPRCDAPLWYSIPLCIDSDSPTAFEISAAIVSAAATLAEKKAAAEAQAAERERLARAEAAEWAALPLSQRASAGGICNFSSNDRYPLETLIKFVPTAYAETLAECERLRELAKGRQAIEDRRVLADFLASIPDDALRGTLKRLAHTDDAISALRDKVENASPVVIFSGDESDESDDDES